ncbi:LuxR C-terminal-related transcriptional regulator [Streptomyces sp. NPDC006372]|uniref:helix-turn-helix transcriptional regulator n=1 Tax=Streptomyces sp. NPDC006372 TaxID=3155599 RepID=UPI0033A30798
MRTDRSDCHYEHLIREAVDAVRAAEGPNLVVISGPDGIELRSALEELLAQGIRLRAGASGAERKVVHLAFSASAPDVRISERLSAMAALLDPAGVVLVFRELNHLNPDALLSLEALVRQLSGTNTLCVCTVALPVPHASRAAFSAALARLRRDRLVHHVALRPLPPRLLGARTTAATGARPEPRLVAWLWRVSRGWPASARVALDIARDEGLTRVVDRHLYLTGGMDPLPPADHDLTLTIREMGSAVWSAAKAMAVLSPLGESAPALVAKGMSLSVEEVRGLLAHLEETGLLRYRRTDGVWQYRLPMVEAALRSSLGPFEQRRLAQLAVSALWEGTARCPDPDYLPRQLANAGKLVDAERARYELLAHTERVAGYDGDRAVEWLRAAADLTADPAQRAGILLRHARACLAYSRADAGLGSSEYLLQTYGDLLRREDFLDVCFVHLASLYRVGEFAALEKVADDGWWPWPGGPLERAFAQAFALSLLGRWRKALGLLGIVRRHEQGMLTGRHVRSILPAAELWLGRRDEFERDIAALPARCRAEEATTDEVNLRAGDLLALGEFRRAERLLADTGRSSEQLGLSSRMVIALSRGDAEYALELARRSIATGPNGCEAVQCAMYHHAATLLLHRGRLSRANELLALARTRQPALPHLLAPAAALYELAFGEAERAQSLLWAAARRAESDGVVAGTDALWVHLADIARSLGRSERLPAYLKKVDGIAHRLGTECAEISRLSLHSVVHSDRSAADAALRLARQRQQPIEESAVLIRLVHHGVVEPTMLSDAYSLLGEIDALMARAWVRLLMRVHGVAVPGRQATVGENERLLAVLVAQNLSNKQIAKALRTSEKSVEGRLSRLFSRTGCRTRVELAMAMLAGRLPLAGE